MRVIIIYSEYICVSNLLSSNVVMDDIMIILIIQYTWLYFFLGTIVETTFFWCFQTIKRSEEIVPILLFVYYILLNGSLIPHNSFSFFYPLWFDILNYFKCGWLPIFQFQVNNNDEKTTWDVHVGTWTHRTEQNWKRSRN